jgi:hypothetical protein
MTVWAFKRSLLPLALVALLVAPAGARQQTPPEEEAPAPVEAPKSLLPGRAAPPAEAPVEELGPLPSESGAPAPAAPVAAAPVGEVAPMDLPAGPVRGPVDIRTIGWLSPSSGGFPATAWSRAQGDVISRQLWALPGQSATPAAHRSLRRLLISNSAAPSGADPIAFVSARTHLLVRMGEAIAAKRLADRVPLSLYSRQFYDVSRQAHLASFDVAGACPLATNAIVFSKESHWALLSAICSGLQGDDGGAALALDLARQGGRFNPFDLQLADRAVTAATGGGGGGLVRWPRNGILTTYRLAVIYGTGQTLPGYAFDRANLTVLSVIARQPMIDGQTRLRAVATASALGVLGPDDYASALAQRGSLAAGRPLGNSNEGLLQRAYTAPRLNDRSQAMRTLWARGGNPLGLLALRQATAGPAAAFPVSAQSAAAAPDLVRAMVMGGRYAQAARWYPALAQASPGQAARIWPLLELTDFANRIPSSPALVEASLKAFDSEGGDMAERRGELLLAVLQGLGYRSAFEADAPWGMSSSSSPNDSPAMTALRRAAGQRSAGEVVVYAAAVMGRDINAVAPEDLREVMRAYVAVGLSSDARLIAAEALAAAGA